MTLLYAVGDVHGQYWKLVQLLSTLPMKDEDRLVFVGDYIDRGPQSREVIELLIELRSARSGTIFLRGNHEQMILDARARRGDFATTALWMGNGGSQTVDSYPKCGRGWIERIPEDHWRFLEETLLEYWDGSHAFVHAGFLPPDAKWPYAEDPRLWVREQFLDSSYDFGARVVFGHTPQSSGVPLVQDNKIGIDTGAAFGGPLTAIGISDDSLQIYQVP